MGWRKKMRQGGYKMRISLIQSLISHPFSRDLLYGLARKRSEKLVEKIINFLPPKKKILDIGAGPCLVSQILKEKDYNVTPLDIVNISFTKFVSPLLYNGKTIPFDHEHFDTAMILSVLHHTPNPEVIIKEAARVSKNIIIQEDLIKDSIHRSLTLIMDSILNLEFRGHPHTNKTDEEWQKLFSKLKLRLTKSIYFRHDLFDKVIYVLET